MLELILSTNEPSPDEDRKGFPSLLNFASPRFKRERLECLTSFLDFKISRSLAID